MNNKDTNLNTLSYRELQKIAIDNNIRANQKKKKLIQELEGLSKKSSSKKSSSKKSSSKKKSFKIELPNDLQKEIYKIKFNQEELDRKTNLIREVLYELENKYKKSDIIDIYDEYDNFFSKIDYKRIIKKFKIHYNDDKNIIIGKIQTLARKIVESKEFYWLISARINNLKSHYDEHSPSFFQENPNEELNIYIDIYETPIYNFIKIFNNNIKYLLKHGFTINIDFINEINNLINEINEISYKIKELNLFLEIPILSNSNSLTRKKNK